ncbi:MAG: two-component system sensor histidine kinase NtrB [Pseudomonadota bacterium]
MSLSLSQQCVKPDGEDSPATATAAREVAQLSAVLDEARSGQREAESQSRRLADRLQALMDALPAAVLVLDRHGRVQEHNPAAVALLQEPLQGRLWRELIQELFMPDASSGDALALRSGRFVTLSTRPLGSEPGQVLMLHDVTDNHRLRRRLEHFQRLADMGRMAASLAHQIRTPLSTAMLYLSRLKAPRLDGERRERMVERAMGSLQGLERLITDMLLFANGKAERREPLSPRQLLEEVGAELERRCGEGAHLHLGPLSDTPVNVNRVLLKSALENLVVNALESGAGNITLAATEEAGQCAIRVSDDGPGIPLERQERIFEPFVSHRDGGTGLGLAVVRAVAQAMGGEVVLHSRPGTGSEFILYLPFDVATA